MADRELLETILATLHGLEMRLNEQDNRRNSGDTTTPSGDESSLTRHGSVSSTNTCACAAYKPPVSQVPHSRASWSPQPAIAYMASLPEIRTRLAFESASDIVTEPQSALRCVSVSTEGAREDGQDLDID